jgi:hypothetical protein
MTDLFNLISIAKHDAFNNILIHFSIFDVYNLSITCKTLSYLHDKMSLVLNKIIDTRLYEIFGNETQIFKQLLEETGGIISGSFVLQCILNEKWDNSDIDIYISLKDNDITYTEYNNRKTEMDDFIYSNSIFRKCDNNIYETPHIPKDQRMFIVRDYWKLDMTNNLNTNTDTDKVKYIVKESNTIDTDHYREIRKCSLYDYKCQPDTHFYIGEHIDVYKNEVLKNKIFRFDDNILYINELGNFNVYKIQIISVNINISDMCDLINNRFDFDICKNTIKYKNGKLQCHIGSFNDCYAKTTKFKHTINEKTSLERKGKYEKRGITFT